MKDQQLGIHSEAIGVSAQSAQQQAEILNAAKRQAERNEKQEAWIDPDAMAYRLILHNKASFESLQSLKRNGQYKVQVPLPPESELPKEMRGQQPSTIRAWMAGNPKYREHFKTSVEELETKEKRRQELRTKHPEMFGIDDSMARRSWKPEEKEKADKKPAFKVTPIAAPEPPKKEAGIVAKIFAGLWHR